MAEWGGLFCSLSLRVRCLWTWACLWERGYQKLPQGGLVLSSLQSVPLPPLTKSTVGVGQEGDCAGPPYKPEGPFFFFTDFTLLYYFFFPPDPSFFKEMLVGGIYVLQ